MTSELYMILGIIGIILAALASWRVITKIRYNNVVSKDNSIAVGGDVNINSEINKKSDDQ
jgi:hypothetical protein